jgi:hypothetical protein
MEFLGTRIARDILTWGKESIKIDEENAKADIILDVGKLEINAQTNEKGNSNDNTNN